MSMQSEIEAGLSRITQLTAMSIVAMERTLGVGLGDSNCEVELKDGRKIEITIKRKAELSAKPQEAHMVVAKKKVAKKAAKKVLKKKAPAKKKVAKKAAKKAAPASDLH